MGDANVMRKVRIERYDSNGERTLGRVFFDGVPKMSSYELPWKNNEKSTSCIPIGMYRCARHISEAYPERRLAYVVKDVPGRQGILFHSGNTFKDTQGCILLGMSIGTLQVSGNYVDAVLSSQGAMSELHDFAVGKEFTLEVVNVNQ
jgi:hypothetical protein